MRGLNGSYPCSPGAAHEIRSLQLRYQETHAKFEVAQGVAHEKDAQGDHLIFDRMVLVSTQSAKLA
jgi:hypothetical protein